LPIHFKLTLDMKQIITLLLTLSPSLVTVAQHFASHQESPASVSPLYIQQSEAFVQPQWNKPLPGARKKISGMVMVGLGAAAQMGGILLIREQRERDKNPTPVCSSCKPADSGSVGILGGMALLAGTGLVTTGTILWWTGSIRLNRSRAAQRQAIQINVGPTSSVSYRL
jgi:hypothetical protein